MSNKKPKFISRTETRWVVRYAEEVCGVLYEYKKRFFKSEEDAWKWALKKWPFQPHKLKPYKQERVVWEIEQGEWK